MYDSNSAQLLLVKHLTDRQIFRILKKLQGGKND